MRSNPPIEVISSFSEPDIEDGIGSITNVNGIRDVEMTAIAPAIAQSKQKDNQSQTEQGPVNTATVREITDLPLSSGVSVPGSMKQTIEVPLTKAQSFPDTAVNIETDVVSPQPKGQTVDISSTVEAKNNLRESNLTVASSAAFAPPQSRERAPRESVLHSAKAPDSDMDEEEIPEINLESDSD